jgi:peptidylprolyl isomerase
MEKSSAKKTVKKDSDKHAKAVPKNAPKKDASKSSGHAHHTPNKEVEKILTEGLESSVDYTYENDSNSLKPKPKKAETGHLVAIDYVGTLKSGEEFDNSKNHGPIHFIVGGGQVIPGFDKAVLGMKVGEKKKFTILKDEAYGDVNPELVQVVPLDKIPEHIRTQLKVGGFLVMQSPMGQQMPVKILKMDKDTVSLDMNHPLAGQDLTFDIKVVDIDHAPENYGSEAHGCGCGHGGCGSESEDDCGDDCDCDDSHCDSECAHEHKHPQEKEHKHPHKHEHKH